MQNLIVRPLKANQAYGLLFYVRPDACPYIYPTLDYPVSLKPLSF
jgi:hypothetical protein